MDFMLLGTIHFSPIGISVMRGFFVFCKADWDIGFNVRVEDLGEFYFEIIFDEIHENCIYWPGEPDEMEVEDTLIVKF